MQRPDKYITQILLLAFLITGNVVFPQEYNAQFYTTHEGLAENEVKDIYQDREGFFWFATGNGLSRFDGYRFKSYGKKEGIKNPIINQVVEDPRGYIWALGRQSIYYLKPGKAFFLQAEGPEVKQYTSIAVFPGNWIVAATDEEGFFEIFGETVDPLVFDLDYANQITRRRVFNQGDSLFFINVNDRIYKYRPDRKPEFIGNFPTGILNRIFIHNKILYMATTEGAFFLDMEKRILQPLLPSTTPYNCLDIMVDSFDHIWLTTNRGLLYIEPNSDKVRLFKTNSNPYISGTWYWRVFEDNVQNIWFSPAGFGIGKLGYRFFVNYTSASGLSLAVHWLIKPSSNGGLFLAGPNGLTHYLRITDFPDKGENHLTGFDVRSLAIESKNKIYLVINNLGFYLYDLVTTDLKKLHPNPSKKEMRSYITLMTSKKELLVGMEDGLYRKSGAKFEQVKLPGITDVLVWELVEDDKGVLWIGTTRGLFAFDSGAEKKWKHWDEGNGLKYQNVKSIVPIASGEVWIAYFEAGGASRINFNEEKVLETLDEDNGLPTNKVFSMAYDQQQQLWLGTAYGLCRVRNKKIDIFDVNQGLLWIDFWRNASFIDQDNAVWFATSLGLTKFLPEYEIYPELDLITKITDAYYDEKEMTPIGSESIAYGDNYVQVNYSAVNFKSEKDIEFFYRLFPQSSEWKPAPQGSIEFRSLAPEKYTFEVRSKSPGRGWSENTDSISFTVDPPFYLRTSFVVFTILLAIAAAWVAIWYRTRGVLQRNIELNTQVEERTMDLANKNTQLQKLINKLQKTQAQLVHSEKMASLGILSSGLAHEVNNPISYALSNALYLKSELHLVLESAKDLPEEVRNHYKDMIEAAEIIVDGSHRVVEVVNNLQSFAHPQEAEYKKADLNYNLEATLKLIRNRYRDRIKFELKLDEMLPEIYCYPSMLNQVFLNLLINAVQAIPEKGNILIESKQLNYKTIQIAIEDDGVGISEDIANRIYDPFFTTKPVGTGTGLGLAISHSIVTGKHKGVLQFSSKPGQGARFEIELPADLPAKPDISKTD